MAEPRSKKAKLAHLGRNAHITASGMKHLLDQLREEDGLPIACSKDSVRRARQEIVFQETSFGPLLQSVSVVDKHGKSLDLHIHHPFGFLEAASRASILYRDLLVRTLNASNNTLGIIVYSDEVTPGQQLLSRNTRK
eukprot:6004271-Pyramimonas_sp.AAC.1